MINVSKGKYTILAHSVKEGNAIISELERLDMKQNRRRLLRRIKHGHDFGYNRTCKCGLTDKNYLLHNSYSQELCSEYKY